MKTKIRLSQAKQQALISQDFQVISEIVKAAFGGKGGGKTSGAKPFQPQSSQELTGAFHRVFG